MNFSVSTRSVIASFLLLFFAWLAWQIKDIIFMVFVALIISMTLVPVIDKIHGRKVSRTLATLLVYATFVTAILFLLGYGLSPLAQQTALFLTQLPKLLDRFLTHPLIEPMSQQIISGLTGQLSGVSGNILQITFNVFSSVVSLVTVIVFSFYFSLEYGHFRERLLKLVRGEEGRRKLSQILQETEVKIGSWVRGELVLGFLIGLMTYAGLTVLRVNYAVPLSVIAGILEIIPMIGPIISAVPAVLVGFAASPILGLGVLALFILIQQVENTLFVPKVMQKAVDLDPILTLLVILIGGKLYGFVGALLAVPVTLVIVIVLKHLYYKSE
ncbi:MAG: AI-2E family transporter [Patescibacteria group bacterium]|nr:AI-2E family transporter [Patescibacteria group bacterium]